MTDADRKRKAKEAEAKVNKLLRAAAKDQAKSKAMTEQEKELRPGDHVYLDDLLYIIQYVRMDAGSCLVDMTPHVAPDSSRPVSPSLMQTVTAATAAAGKRAAAEKKAEAEKRAEEQKAAEEAEAEKRAEEQKAAEEKAGADAMKAQKKKKAAEERKKAAEEKKKDAE